MLLQFVPLSPFLPVAFAIGYVLWQITRFLVKPYTSSIRHLRGPRSPGWLLGHIKQVNALSEAWVEQYGETFKYKGFCGVRSTTL